MSGGHKNLSILSLLFLIWKDLIIIIIIPLRVYSFMAFEFTVKNDKYLFNAAGTTSAIHLPVQWVTEHPLITTRKQWN